MELYEKLLRQAYAELQKEGLNVDALLAEDGWSLDKMLAKLASVKRAPVTFGAFPLCGRKVTLQDGYLLTEVSAGSLFCIATQLQCVRDESTGDTALYLHVTDVKWEVGNMGIHDWNDWDVGFPSEDKKSVRTMPRYLLMQDLWRAFDGYRSVETYRSK